MKTILYKTFIKLISYKEIPQFYLFMRRILLFFVLLSSLSVFGQTDTKFWFAAPDIAYNHGDDGRPLFLRVSAVYNTNVVITRPAIGDTLASFPLAQGETQSFDLIADLGLDLANDIECKSLNGVENKGFYIEAGPGEITAFYELNNQYNRDIFALKGQNALGTEFTITTQNIYNNSGSDRAYSGFVVVATENNTIVTVQSDQNFYNHPAGTYSITLNKGQTYNFEATSKARGDHPQGVKVTTNAGKPIAVTLYDDSMMRNASWGNGGCLDTFGDQYIPDNLAGKEYLVMRGQLGYDTLNIGGNWRTEFIIVTALEDGTIVNVKGEPNSTDTLDAREVFACPIYNRLTYVSLSKPGLVNHITGTGYGCEQGGAILPSIDNCTGSYDVTFSRTGPSSDYFTLNIMVRNDTANGSPNKNKAASCFTLYDNNQDSFHIPASFFDYTPDSAFAYLKDDSWTTGPIYSFFETKIETGEVGRINNSLSRFHLGVLIGRTTNGAKHGYFSDYAANKVNAGLGGATAPTVGKYCNLDPLRLVASGGYSYYWTCTTHPHLNSNISDRSAAAPYFYPDTSNLEVYKFSVFIQGECYDTTINLQARVVLGPVSDFSLSEVEGCSPFTTTITNLTNTFYADKMTWIYNPPKEEVNQATLPMSFDKTFTNTTNSAQKVSIKLYSLGPYNTCPNILERTIIVLPEVKADFERSDSIGCHPFPVSFTNLSSGHLDSTSYFWDFGNNSQSFDFEPSEIFTNVALNDSIYYTRLVVESPLGCKDTLEKFIQVHPKIKANFSVDTNYGCSPLTFELNPSNSVGVDTFKWHIDYFYDDSVFTTTSKNLVSITHHDTSYASGPDTLKISLQGINEWGCSNQTSIKNLVVYPEIQSVIGISDSAVCDSVPITLTNSSLGNNLRFEWNFGDNTYKYDNTRQSHTKTYLNRTNSDKTYNIILKAISNFNCESLSDTSIIIHPYVKADFGISFENNCSPLDVVFNNNSTRSHINIWNMGDGYTSDSLNKEFTHRYLNTNINSNTSFSPKLVVYNQEGCKDSITRSIMLYPPVVASFTPIDSSGCSPFVLPVENHSTGGSLTYTWDFGDNVSSSASSPAFNKTYTNYTNVDTVYTIVLTAKNAAGCDSSVSGTVKVFASIDADFTLSVRDTCSPYIPHVKNLSSAGANFTDWYVNGNYLSNEWEPTSPPEFVNTGLKTDTVNLMLVAYGKNDIYHKACADTQAITLHIFPELTVDFELDTNAACQPFISNIQNTSNIISGSSFQWSLDNSFYSSATTPHTLKIPNLTNNNILHNLKVIGKTQYGCRDTLDKDFTVFSLVDAQFTVSKPAICSKDSILIDRTASRGGITGYNWNFNNELQESNSDNGFYHSFRNTNNSLVNKFIELTVVNNEGCDSSWTEYVTVYPEVNAEFNTDFTGVCYPHNTVFTNNSVNANTYYWDFDDGTKSTLNSPAHTFKNNSKTTNKSFDVKLIAKSEYLCVDSITKKIDIYAKPYANFSFPVSVACPPFNVVIENLSEGNSLSYNWDFAGDGSSTEFETSFSFTNNSSVIMDKPITLIVTSANNCKDSLIKKARVYPKVTVDFTPSSTNGCSPMWVDFDGNISNAQQIQWLINNKTFSTIDDPSYNFQNETPDNKQFYVKLKASSLYNCYDSVQKLITLYPTPIADFIADPSPVNYNTDMDETQVNFSNETIFQNKWNYEWSFGDGSTGNETDYEFTHRYPAFFWGLNADDNRVPVQLIAKNKIHSACSDTVIHDIIIYPPTPEIDIFEDVAGCEPFEVSFEALTKYVYEDQFEWDFGNGTTSMEQGPIVIFDEPGQYTIKLLVRGEGGTNWDSKTVDVYPQPEADFIISDTSTTVGSQTKDDDLIKFYNKTKYGAEYEWFFDKESFLNGGIADSYDKEPTYAYPEVGDYQVVLVAKSEYGCFDTLIHPEIIHVKGEGLLVFPSGFYVNPTMGPGDDYYTDQSSGNLHLFYPENKGVEKYSLEIYNRWGVLLFKTEDVNQGWNGFIDGVPAKQDVYVWRAKGRYTNGEPFNISGDVTLIRSEVNLVPLNE
ncbi:MAG: gliding motility-associated C-terminal domain-containing protein [Bacteroidales bacterium]|nr:gliding motility-associated C-terminal domain-containing protein [Bacteroidales bacterium]MBN2818498.1 gliding motility-associated C-terminal domain-containing protein [Bacteroidales bacterium]